MSSGITIATLQAVCLSTVSNILAQLIEAYGEQRPFSLDLGQFLRFVTCAFITTPPNYQWQQLLERTFPMYAKRTRAEGDVEKDAKTGGISPSAVDRPARGKPKLNLRNTAMKWFIDCMTVGALVNTVVFLVLMGMMKRQSIAQIEHNLRTQTIPIIVAGFKIWPVASIISFAFVPVERRIVFLNVIGLIWGIYMSLVAEKV